VLENTFFSEVLKMPVFDISFSYLFFSVFKTNLNLCKGYCGHTGSECNDIVLCETKRPVTTRIYVYLHTL
jgi:hypothetical protein